MSYMNNLVAVARVQHQESELLDALMSQVRRRLPGVDVRMSYDHSLEEQRFVDTLRDVGGPAVVVPLELDSGAFVSGVVPLLARAAGVSVRVSRPLGPDPLIAAVLAERLQAGGARRGDAVVLVAETSESEAVVDAFTSAKLLQSYWGAPVRVAHLHGTGDRLATVADRLWQDGHRRIAAAPYLLTPGDAAHRMRTQATVAGCAGVGEVLGNHRLLAELVVRRFLAASASHRVAAAPRGLAARVA